MKKSKYKHILLLAFFHTHIDTLLRHLQLIIFTPLVRILLTAFNSWYLSKSDVFLLPFLFIFSYIHICDYDDVCLLGLIYYSRRLCCCCCCFGLRRGRRKKSKKYRRKRKMNGQGKCELTRISSKERTRRLSIILKNVGNVSTCDDVSKMSLL